MMRYAVIFAAGLSAVAPAAGHPQHHPSAPAAAAKPASANAAAIRAVLADYMSAIEKLDARGTERLFATNSMIFETGGSEGTYANYLSHHLTPELGEFKSFKFSDYKVDVRFEGPLALATETYRYSIETKNGETAARIGVATSVLKQENGQWKIVMMHNSSRRPSAT